MSSSEARVIANRQNALKSTGPKTPEGKEVSRRNALKHGLTGEGIVLPNEDVAEVERRLASFRDELQPTGEVSETLVRRAAILSVRLDRCVSHETAALASRIRQAEADFVGPEGLDAETTAQLKAEAKARAMFDPSPEATRARQYEAAAERGFHKALKELRLLQNQAQAQAQAVAPRTVDQVFEESLASFSRFNADCDAFEAKFFDDDLPSPSPGDQTPATRPISDLVPPGGRADHDRPTPLTGPSSS